ncbi:ribonuclease H-like domain-containing protein [Tanacetum coccineum]
MVRRSTRQKVMPAKFNDFVVNSSVKYGLEKYVCYANLSNVNYCFSTTLNNSTDPKTFHEASQNPKWIKVMNLEMEALYKAILVTKGFGQREGIDYGETFSHVVKMVTVSEYGLLACKLAATPLQQNVVLSYEESDHDKFLPNMNEYQKISHFTAALRVLRYQRWGCRRALGEPPRSIGKPCVLGPAVCEWSFNIEVVGFKFRWRHVR